MMIGPLDHKAIFESDLWNCFMALGEGFSVFLYQTSFEKIIWGCRSGGPFPSYDLNVMDVLLQNELYEKKENNTLVDAEALYEYTQKGRQLHEEIKDLPIEESQRTFLSRIEFDWSKF